MSPQRSPVGRFSGRAVALPLENIDTDQIIPARFLTTTSRSGLGRWLFADWRYREDGTPRVDFVLNQATADGASVLVAGANFGCGSSREHAPWALCDFGFRAVVSTSFADIFRQNALKNALLPIVLPADVHLDLLQRVERDPGATVSVDLVRQRVTLPGRLEAAFAIDPFARECLLNGVDEIGYVLKHDADIERYERLRM